MESLLKNQSMEQLLVIIINNLMKNLSYKQIFVSTNTGIIFVPLVTEVWLNLLVVVIVLVCVWYL